MSRGELRLDQKFSKSQCHVAGKKRLIQVGRQVTGFFYNKSAADQVLERLFDGEQGSAWVEDAEEEHLQGMKHTEKTQQ